MVNLLICFVLKVGSIFSMTRMGRGGLNCMICRKIQSSTIIWPIIQNMKKWLNDSRKLLKERWKEYGIMIWYGLKVLKYYIKKIKYYITIEKFNKNIILIIFQSLIILY